MPRPRAGDWLEDEIKGWKADGIDLVVSLLEPEEITELGLEGEFTLCRAAHLELLSFPFADRGVPTSIGETIRFVRGLTERLSEGKAVAIHCRAGIGRAALVAACVLVLLGFDPGAAFELIGEARGVKVPDTPDQQNWVAKFQQAERIEAVTAQRPHILA